MKILDLDLYLALEITRDFGSTISTSGVQESSIGSFIPTSMNV